MCRRLQFVHTSAISIGWCTKRVSPCLVILGSVNKIRVDTIALLYLLSNCFQSNDSKLNISFKLSKELYLVEAASNSLCHSS